MVVSAVREFALQKHNRGNGKGNKYKWRQAQIYHTHSDLSSELDPWHTAEPSALGSLGQLDSEFKISLVIPNYSEQAPAPQTKPCVA